jgi:hypothetical protein
VEELTVTGHVRWSRSILVIERLVPRQPATAREVWHEGARWQISSSSRHEGDTGLPLHWPEVTLRPGEKVYDRAERIEVELRDARGERHYVDVSEQTLATAYAGRRVLLDHTDKGGAYFFNPPPPE